MHTTMQLYEYIDDGFDCHVIERAIDEKDAPPVIRSHRNISQASVRRFLRLSGGNRTAYGMKERGQ